MTFKEQPKDEVLHTKIWYETAEKDNPFVASKSFCAGYDVYGDILKKATWFEYLYLLFRLERPKEWQTELLEKIAIAIANPGIRDHSVRAAMNAGAGGSTSASALMASLAVGAGSLGGAREVLICANYWKDCGRDLSKWKETLSGKSDETLTTEVDSWPEMEHPPGFDPNGVSCAEPVKQVLAHLAAIDNAKNTQWLNENRTELEKIATMPLAITFVVCAALDDIGFSAQESEMLYLFLRLPGAAVHSLEQKKLGYKKYPFFLGRIAVDGQADK